MEFGILGQLVVARDGRSLALGQEKLRALLAALLLSRNQVAASELLIEDLWGERPPKTARATIQVYVAQLRKLLEADPAQPERVLTRDSGYLLRAADGEVDIDRFERLVEEGREALHREADAIAATRLRKALDLWRGAPLVDLDSQRAAQERHRLETIRLGVEEDWVDAELRMGHHDRVLEALTGLVEEQPFRERRWGQLMLALYRSGRQAEALRAFQDARRILGEELGIEPGVELRRLEEAILLQDPSLDLAEKAVPAEAPGARRLPLLGRRTELAVLDDALRLSDQGVAVVVSVRGAPGTGKSRLLEELMARPGERAVRAARAYRSDGESPGRLMEDLELAGVDLSSLALVVDDAHWADPTSLAGLRRLVLQADRGLLMVLAHRPVSGIQASTMHRLWDAARATGELVPVDLGFLEPADLLPVVAGEAPEVLASRLIAASGGLPFRLEELVASLLEAGILKWRGDLLAATGDQEVLVAEAGDRLSGLSAAEKRLLECVSVSGRPVSPEAAALVVGVERPEVLDLGETLARQGLFRETAEGFLPAHDLVADQVEAGMGEVRKAETRRLVADTLTDLGVDQGEPAWVGGLYLAAARWQEAFPHLARAAWEAAQRKAYVEALPLAEGALEAYRRARLNEPTLEARLRYVRAWGAWSVGQAASIEEDVDVAVRLLEGRELLDALALAAQVASDQNDYPTAEWMLAVAEREAFRLGDLGMLGSLYGDRAGHLDFLGFTVEAAELHRRGEELVAVHGDDFQRLNAVMNSGTTASFRGEARRSLQAFRSAMEWARRAGGDFLPLVESWLARSLLLTGRIAEGREAYWRALQAAEREQFTMAIANSFSSLSVGLESIGRYEEALRAAEDSLSTVLQYLPGSEGLVRIQRAKALIGLGHFDDAEVELRNAGRALTSDVGVSLWRSRCRVARLEVAAARGGGWPISEVVRLADEVEASCRWDLLVDLLILRARCEQDPALAVRAAELALELGSPMKAARAAHAGDVWSSEVGERVTTALRDMEAHVPSEWFDDWATLPYVAPAVLGRAEAHR